MRQYKQTDTLLCWSEISSFKQEVVGAGQRYEMMLLTWIFNPF